MDGHLLIGLTSILVFGVGAQWVAWRFKFPAILLLLISGITAGPILGLLDPDLLMGDLLAPFVSVSVTIILFKRGLSLRFSELIKHWHYNWKPGEYRGTGNRGQLLKQENFKVILADSNWSNINKARKAGLDTYYGNVLGENATEDLNLDGVGKLMTLFEGQTHWLFFATAVSSGVQKSFNYRLHHKCTCATVKCLTT